MGRMEIKPLRFRKMRGIGLVLFWDAAGDLTADSLASNGIVRASGAEPPERDRLS
jgi:hypothetical protein